MGSLKTLSQVLRIEQGSTSKAVVISAGYSLAELLQDIGLEVHWKDGRFSKG